jgi:hypothetical protein
MAIPAIGQPFPWMFLHTRKREHIAKFPFFLSCSQTVKLSALFDPMKLFSYFLAFASLASLALGCASLLIVGPFPALLGFLGFALLGFASVKINPEI